VNFDILFFWNIHYYLFPAIISNSLHVIKTRMQCFFVFFGICITTFFLDIHYRLFLSDYFEFTARHQDDNAMWVFNILFFGIFITFFFRAIISNPLHVIKTRMQRSFLLFFWNIYYCLFWGYSLLSFSSDYFESALRHEDANEM